MCLYAYIKGREEYFKTEKQPILHEGKLAEMLDFIGLPDQNEYEIDCLSVERFHCGDWTIEISGISQDYAKSENMRFSAEYDHNLISKIGKSNIGPE